MTLIKHYLGEFIERLDNRNEDLFYGIEYVRGVSNDKELMPTKADLDGRNLSKFRIVNPGDFVYNHRTSRHGGKFCIAYNSGTTPIICTEDYTVFKIKDTCKKILLDTWLFMFFNRPEFDRYVMYNSWGSSTEFFNWSDICEVQFDLPDSTVQQKYIDVYKSLKENQRCYESGLDDLKLVCDGYIEALRRKLGTEKIGPYIIPIEERNTDLSISLAQGITIEKMFAPPKQVAQAEKNAKIVRRGQFAYNRATTRNGDKISIAYREGEDCVVSSAYQVFEVKEKDKLLSEYLMMWFKRSEFDRYARYMSKGSAHEFFEYSDMEEVKIPIPSITIQKSIVDIYAVYIKRQEINKQLKRHIKDICQILIKGSIEEEKKREC